MNAVLFGGGRCIRCRRGGRGWSRLRIRGWGIGGEVEIVADGFAPGIGAVGVDVFVLGEGQGLDYNGEKRIALPQGRGGRRGALAAIALAGLKTRHYNLRAWKAQRYGCAARGVRQWRPSAKVKEHKEERSLERLVDIEVSRKKD